MFSGYIYVFTKCVSAYNILKDVLTFLFWKCQVLLFTQTKVSPLNSKYLCHICTLIKKFPYNVLFCLLICNRFTFSIIHYSVVYWFCSLFLRILVDLKKKNFIPLSIFEMFSKLGYICFVESEVLHEYFPWFTSVVL